MNKGFSHLLLLLLIFAKLEAEGVDTDEEVGEHPDEEDHVGDDQSPGKFGGDAEVVTLGNREQDLGNPEAHGGCNPGAEDFDKDLFLTRQCLYNETKKDLGFKHFIDITGKLLK